MIKLPKRTDNLKPFVTLYSNCSLFVQLISFMDIEYADNDIGRFDGWMDTVGVLPSYPDSNGVRVNFMPIYLVIDDTNLDMELETMDIVDMVASSDVRCCSM